MIFEIPKIRVKILLKAVVLGVFLHSEQESNLRCDYWELVNSTPWGTVVMAVKIYLTRLFILIFKFMFHVLF